MSSGAHKSYAIITDPDARGPIEYDTASCGHCQAIIFTKPGSASTVYLLPCLPAHPGDLTVLNRWQEEAGAFCRQCMRSICLPCYQTSLTARIPCVVWERQFEEAEKRQRGLLPRGAR